MRDQGLAGSRRWAEKVSIVVGRVGVSKLNLPLRPHSTLTLVPRFRLENKISYLYESHEAIITQYPGTPHCFIDGD